MERLWSSPRFQPYLHGDTRLAAPHIRQARVYAGYLFDQLIGGQTTRFEWWREPNGVTIWVQVWRDVLGDRAIAHIFTQAIDEQVLLLLPAPESGFLNLEDLSTGGDREFPALYQSGRTLRLYNSIRQSPPPQNEPPSHWFNEAELTPTQITQLRGVLDTKIALAPYSMRATGKFRLYHQARRGMTLQFPALPVEAVYNDPGHTRGLWRDRDFVYWRVDIEARQSEPKVTFTKMVLPDSDDATRWLRQLKLYVAAGSGYEEAALIVETWILGNLTASTNPSDTHVARIMASESEYWAYPGYAAWEAYSDPYYSWPLPGPISQGWKFSRNGDKAACVIIETVASATHYFNFFQQRADLRSHVVELSFDKVEIDGNLSFSVMADTRETSDWHYSHDWGYWLWVVGEYQMQPWVLPGDILFGSFSFDPPDNAPIYGFYTDAGLTLFRISRQSEDIDQSVYRCEDAKGKVWGWSGGGLDKWTNVTYEGEKVTETLTFGQVSESAVGYPVKLTLEAKSTPSGEWGDWYPVFAGSFVNCVESNSCGATGYYPVDTPGEIIQQSEWHGTGDAIVEEVETIRGQGVRLGILDTNAEAVVVAKSSVNRVYQKTTTSTYGEVPGAPNATQFAIRNDVCPNAAPSSLSFPASVAIDERATITADDWLMVVGRTGVGGRMTYSISRSGNTRDDIAIQTVPGYFMAFKSLEDFSWATGLRVAQGVGPEMHVAINALEVDDVMGIMGPSVEAWRNSRLTFYGYPPELAGDDKTSPIGFA